MNADRDGTPAPTYGRPNWMEVDEAAIAHNIAAIRNLIGREAKIFVALKGNACGFGYVQAACSTVAAGAHGISTVDLGEAVRIRESGVQTPIVVYAGNLMTAESVEVIARHDLIPTIHNRASAEGLSRHAPRPLRAFVEINVGGERFGIDVDEAPAFVAGLRQMARLTIGGVYAHMHVPSDAAAVPTVDWQYRRFLDVLAAIRSAGIEVPLRMIASSKVLMLTTGMSLDAVDPGHLVFGLDPGGRREVELKLRPALLGLKSRLVEVKRLARSEFRDQAPFPVRDGLVYGVIPMGHADRLPLLHAGAVLVRGRRVPFLGKPSAEHTRIDLTGCPEAEVGDEVVLVGRQGEAEIALAEVQRHQGGVRASDITRAIPAAIPRLYVTSAASQAAARRSKALA